VHFAGFLLNERNLPPRLVLRCAHHVANTVHVLDLDSLSKRRCGAGRERSVETLGVGLRAKVRRAHADVQVAAHGAFLHVPVTHVQMTQQVLQLAHDLPRLERAAEVRFHDDLQQRRARSVEVHDGALLLQIVVALARVLLDLDARDAHTPGHHVLVVLGVLGLPLPQRLVLLLAGLVLGRVKGRLFALTTRMLTHHAGQGQIEVQRAARRHWCALLCQLIPQRQIAVEVVLALEQRARVERGIHRQTRADGLPHALAVHHGQRAR